MDNEGYMNTGMQRSGTTPFGSWTSTTPVGPALRGKPKDAKYMPLVMLMHNCEYVATAVTAYIKDFHEKLEKAHQASNAGLPTFTYFRLALRAGAIPETRRWKVQRRACSDQHVSSSGDI